MNPKVMIILGSGSDIKIAEKSMKVLDKLEIPYSLKIASAHRTHEKLKNHVIKGTEHGVEVFIGIAGLAAHLPGAIASYTHKPVIGDPVESKLNGLDALYSVVQMPYPIPVASVGIDRGDNAAILAGQILGIYDEKIRENVHKIRLEYQDKVYTSEKEVLSQLESEFLEKEISYEYTSNKFIEISDDYTYPNPEDNVDKSQIAIIPGSYSDMPIAKKVASILDRMKIKYELHVVSPVRYPEKFKKDIEKMKNVQVFIGVNGLSSHVTGSIVGLSEKTILGVPCANRLGGEDSLFSMVSMPPGVPVGTVGIENGRNAAILAGEILAIGDKEIEKNLIKIKNKIAKVDLLDD